MSAAASTKVFGLSVKDSPRKLIALVALVVAAGVLYFINSRNDESSGSSSSGTVAQGVNQSPTSVGRRAPRRVLRTTTRSNERGTLKLRAIDARSGDIDPTLRLDLLARLQTLQMGGINRSLFEAGAPPVQAITTPVPKVIIPVTAPPPIVPPQGTTPPPTPIPLKFYGFVRPKGTAGVNRGFFMDGEDILVGSEGELLKQRYKVIELKEKSALVEDTVSKSQQTLALVPEAQGGS